MFCCILLLIVEMMQSTLNKVQVDHDVDIALRSLQRGNVVGNITDATTTLVLTAILHDTPGKPVLEYLQTGFCWS